MRYENIRRGRFLERPNRFVALVELDGTVVYCHVKNTGRCRELLCPGVVVVLQYKPGLGRKTDYDLIAVWKGERLINMDAQAPNRVVGEALAAGLLGPVTALRAEQTWGDSRFDFSFYLEERLYYLEVKGVTLEENGIVRFPDAPTLRGARHLRELAQCAQEGLGACLLLVIQMEGAQYFAPNDDTDPAFGKELRAAARAGVQILAYDCRVTENSMVLRAPVPIVLEE